MKIVNRESFLNLPSNTLYHKYESIGVYGGLQIKSSEGDYWKPDWVYTDLHHWLDGANSGNDLIDILSKCEEDGSSFSFDLEVGCRDGLYEDEQLFAVYEKTDIEKLIKKLSSLLTHTNIKLNNHEA